MKGLSVAMIGGVVLALVGVTVLVALVSDVSPIDSESGFCQVYSGLNPSLPDSITPTVAGCKDAPEVNYKEVTTEDPEEFALKLGVGIQECWSEFNGYETDFQRCEAWSAVNLDSEVKESDVNQKMKENNICPELIENYLLESGSGTGCGSENQIVFSSDGVEQGDFVIVGYNSTGSGFVEVK